MKILGSTVTLAAVLLSASSSTPAQAGRGCGRPGGRPVRVVRVVAPPAIGCQARPDGVAMPLPPQPYAIAAPLPPQPMPQAAAVAPQAPTLAAPIPAGGAPTYTYQASPGAGPAYYYTYDKDDRLIPVQWMDWLFRGGREAGEPRPPLPIIGRLQGR